MPTRSPHAPIDGRCQPRPTAGLVRGRRAPEMVGRATWGPSAPAPTAGWDQPDPGDPGTTSAVLSHAACFFLAVFLVLIFRQTKGKTNDRTRHHATEALNFQLTFASAWFTGVIVLIASAATGADDDAGWRVPPVILMGVLGGPPSNPSCRPPMGHSADARRAPPVMSERRRGCQSPQATPIAALDPSFEPGSFGRRASRR
jgi:hypothetical protein